MTKKQHDLVLSRDTPHESAQEFRKRQHPDDSKYQEDWLDYDGAAYQFIENDTIKSEIRKFLISAEVMDAIEVTDKKTARQRMYLSMIRSTQKATT